MYYYIGMDIGGTYARMKLADSDGKILGEFTGRGCTLNVEGLAESEQRYRNLILSSLEQIGLSVQNCGGICAAASGVDSPELALSCRQIFINMGFNPECITVSNDCEIFLHYSTEPGVVLVSGTGSIAVGHSKDGHSFRCGGWGHILSDEGSGYYMGRSVLHAVGNHIDGRISCPRLYELFCEMSELRTLPELNLFLNENVSNKTKIACFAPLADRAALDGDEAAIQIIEDSAQQLFALVRDVLKKMGPVSGNETVPVWLWGSVLTHSKPVYEKVKVLLEQGLHARVAFPPCNALDAALSVAQRGNRITEYKV